MRQGWWPGGLAALLIVGAACGGTQRVTGRVFSDDNGDGLWSAGEAQVAGATVWWETGPSSTTGGDGGFVMDVPERDGIVWVRTPDGYQPSPTWTLHCQTWPR